jgi:uncharacterized protein
MCWVSLRPTATYDGMKTSSSVNNHPHSGWLEFALKGRNQKLVEFLVAFFRNHRHRRWFLKTIKTRINAMPGSAQKFICDSMLGRLAKGLRMLGFDTLYARTLNPQPLVQTALDQQRVILTRRTTFPKKTPSGSILCIHSNSPKEQLREVITAYPIDAAAVKPFTICLRCNAALAAIEKEAAAGHVPDYVYATVEHFSACPTCGRVYWKGSHYANMADDILKITE